MTFDRLAASIGDLFSNPIIMSALTGWLLSQFIKGIITLLNTRTRTVRDFLEAILWRTGGMPSSHTALVSSMTAAVAFAEGFTSSLFAVSLFIALVVMRDAVGVRRSSGQQARALNLLGKQTAEKQGVEFEPVKEIRGHHPLEVIVGAIMGIFIAAAYTWL